MKSRNSDKKNRANNGKKQSEKIMNGHKMKWDEGK